MLPTSYKSPLPFVSERFHAAAVYCSDGRFGSPIDEFLTNGLSLERVDRLAIPGGPAGLAAHPEAKLEQRGVLEELHFLVDAHELDRVILIQHAGCAFYGMRLGVAPEHLPSLQRADLVRAAHVVRQVSPDVSIGGWIANVVGGSIQFDPVDLT